MDLLYLESIFETQLKTRVTKKLGKDYPNMSFITEVTDKTPSFPNVYIHELDPSEVGRDISNDTIHAVRSTMQIEVTSNMSKGDARKVANACILASKSLSYSVISGPVYTKINNLHRFVMRVRRIVASGDSF